MLLCKVGGNLPVISSVCNAQITSYTGQIRKRCLKNFTEQERNEILDEQDWSQIINANS